MSDQKSGVRYPDYLELDNILNAQHLRSPAHGEPAHDEMLFIIIHQVYELWFKQILHEMGSLMDMFSKGEVDEHNIGVAVSRLDRVKEIQKVLINQIHVLETMTPMDFLDFRDYLVPASGFQSAQFRVVERKMGIELEDRMRYTDKKYYEYLRKDEKEMQLKYEGEKSLFRLIEDWLERTPFTDFDGWNFKDEYEKAIRTMLEEQRETIRTNTVIFEDEKPRRLQMIDDSEVYFESIFDVKIHNELMKKGERKLSHKATLAALFINLYRDQPILHLPYKLLSGLADVDELFTTWRYNHSLMVLRMIGKKVGTGGSSGHEYLKATAEKHKVFVDLFNLSTLLIPRSALPELPADFAKKLGFHFSTLK